MKFEFFEIDTTPEFVKEVVVKFGCWGADPDDIYNVC